MKKLQMICLGALSLGAALALTPLASAADQQPTEKPATAQGGGQRPLQSVRAQERLKKMAEDLKLNDEQKKKFEAANKAQAEKAQKLRQDTALTAEERRTKTRALREENDKKMKEILTKEQYEKYQKMLQEQRQNAGRSRRSTTQ